jgi:hypothetical protein
MTDRRESTGDTEDGASRTAAAEQKKTRKIILVNIIVGKSLKVTTMKKTTVLSFSNSENANGWGGGFQPRTSTRCEK